MSHPLLKRQLLTLQQKYPEVSIVSNENHTDAATVPHVKLPCGWNMDAVEVKFIVPAGYPQACPSDFWVFPRLRLAHGGSPQNSRDCWAVPGIPAGWMFFMWCPTKWDPNSDDLLTFVNVIRRRLAWVT